MSFAPIFCFQVLQISAASVAYAARSLLQARSVAARNGAELPLTRGFKCAAAHRVSERNMAASSLGLTSHSEKEVAMLGVTNRFSIHGK